MSKELDVDFLCPIHNNEQYLKVLKIVEQLVFKSQPTIEELDYLDVLSLFIEQYENNIFGEISE